MLLRGVFQERPLTCRRFSIAYYVLVKQSSKPFRNETSVGFSWRNVNPTQCLEIQERREKAGFSLDLRHNCDCGCHVRVWGAVVGVGSGCREGVAVALHVVEESRIEEACI